LSLSLKYGYHAPLSTYTFITVLGFGHCLIMFPKLPKHICPTIALSITNAFAQKSPCTNILKDHFQHQALTSLENTLSLRSLPFRVRLFGIFLRKNLFFS
jgi:hypothetical protein